MWVVNMILLRELVTLLCLLLGWIKSNRMVTAYGVCVEEVRGASELKGENY
jgi:hypothetical protein